MNGLDDGFELNVMFVVELFNDKCFVWFDGNFEVDMVFKFGISCFGDVVVRWDKIDVEVSVFPFVFVLGNALNVELTCFDDVESGDELDRGLSCL